MVARQVSDPATNLGLDASRPAVLSYRQHAETQPASKPTRSARRSECSWAGDQLMCRGIAAACTPAANFPGRSTNSSPNDPHVARGCGHEIIRIRRALSCRCPVNRIAERHGSLANRNSSQQPTSQHHGPGAEPGGKAAPARGRRRRGKHGCSSPNSASPSNATDISSKAGARFSDGENRRA